MNNFNDRDFLTGRRLQRNQTSNTKRAQHLPKNKCSKQKNFENKSTQNDSNFKTRYENVLNGTKLDSIPSTQKSKRRVTIEPSLDLFGRKIHYPKHGVFSEAKVGKRVQFNFNKEKKNIERECNLPSTSSTNHLTTLIEKIDITIDSGMKSVKKNASPMFDDLDNSQFNLNLDLVSSKELTQLKDSVKTSEVNQVPPQTTLMNLADMQLPPIETVIQNLGDVNQNELSIQNVTFDRIPISPICESNNCFVPDMTYDNSIYENQSNEVLLFNENTNQESPNLSNENPFPYTFIDSTFDYTNFENYSMGNHLNFSSNDNFKQSLPTGDYASLKPTYQVQQEFIKQNYEPHDPVFITQNPLTENLSRLFKMVPPENTKLTQLYLEKHSSNYY